MRKKIVYTAYVLVAYCLFLVWTFPADRAYGVFQEHLPLLKDKVSLSQVDGTLWHGRAAMAVIDGIAFNNFSWSLQPFALLGGHVQVFLRCRIPDGSLQGKLSFGRQDLSVHNFVASIPAVFFDQQTKPFGVGLNGALSAKVSQLVVQDGRIVEAEGTMVWSGAQVVEPQLVKLGDLKAQWTTEENGEILGVLSDGGGPLQAQGTFKLSGEGKYDFSGSFRSRDRTQPALLDTLQLFGRPGKDGAIRASLSGKMPLIEVLKKKDEGKKTGEQNNEK